MSGVKIDRVIEDSIAYQCGFRCGDVVLEVGKNAVMHPFQIFHELAKNKPNGFAQVKVMRDGQELIHNMCF
jgi:S1-C subfamily serine protease